MKSQQIKTKDKKVNLRVWISAEIIPSLWLFAYYWMCIKHYYQPIHVIIQYAFIGCMILFLMVIRGKRDVFDEFAKETLYKTNTICLDIAYIIMAIILFNATFINQTAVIIGYLIAGGIVILSVTRAIIFCVIDSEGM